MIPLRFSPLPSALALVCAAAFSLSACGTRSPGDSGVSVEYTNTAPNHRDPADLALGMLPAGAGGARLPELADTLWGRDSDRKGETFVFSGDGRYAGVELKILEDGK